MLTKGLFCVGALYGHDSWSQYWEGTLERVNGNIGTVTTQSVNLAANYAVNNRINILASAPYMWTDASAGVLHGQSSFQDFTLAAKVNVLQAPLGTHGTVRLMVVGSASKPVSSYSPDLMPLSIGTQSSRVSGRTTLNYVGHQGFYVTGTMAYTLRGNVTLQRSFYFTNDQLYLSNEVAMPNVFDYATDIGYRHRDLELVGDFSQQLTRGGGDIRRQDMPFVSNRMNASRVGFTLKYPIPHHHRLQYWTMYRNTFSGRNVGQANTITTGLMYTFHFEGHNRPTP